MTHGHELLSQFSIDSLGFDDYATLHTIIDLCSDYDARPLPKYAELLP
jgi:hypothetical protein